MLMPHTKDPISELAQRLRNGDATAIAELYHLYYDRIYAFVFRCVSRNHQDAEDVVQDIWLSTAKAAKKFRGDSQPYTWLYGIAINKVRGFQRRHHREMSRRHVARDTSFDPEIANIIDTEPLPHEIIEKEETKELVRRALAYLPSHYQEVLTLKYVEHMSSQEISRVMGRSTKAIGCLLDRARRELRKKIVGENE